MPNSIAPDSTASISKELLSRLCCPKSHKELLYFAQGVDEDKSEFLLCAHSRLRFEVREGLANLLLDDAKELTQEEVDSLVAQHQS